jgi:CubicO group peptidase (beta-lactamase class C family)
MNRILTWRFVGTGAAMMIAVAGCSAAEPEPEPEPTSQAVANPSVWTNTQISDENINKAVTDLPDLVQQAMSTVGVPGISVAVVQGDEVLSAQGFGVREVGGSEPVDADTVFQIASLSKAVGATVVSRSVSQGEVAWEDTVQQYLPWFTLKDKETGRAVTIADMYSHRSGLPDHAGDQLEDLGFQRTPILKKLAQLPLGLFRVQYAYTNFGLTAGGEAAAKANKTTWEQLSQDLLYEPTGMDSTSSEYSDYLAADNRAVTHTREGDTWVPGPPRDPQPQSPAGGVSSTANDMAKWLQVQVQDGTFEGKELIKPEVLQQMRDPHSRNGPGADPAARPSMYGYGTGTGVDGTGHVRWSHSGAFLLGVGTAFEIIPEANLGIVVLTNGQPYGVPEAIAASFVDIVETGSVQRDWLAGYEKAFSGFYINPSELADKEPPTNPKAPEALNEYTGVYSNSYYGPAKVTKSGKNLMMELGPKNMQFKLSHWDGNVFSYQPTGENAVGISAVTFNPTKGKMTVEHLNEYELGVFQK